MKRLIVSIIIKEKIKDIKVLINPTDKYSLRLILIFAFLKSGFKLSKYLVCFSMKGERRS